MSARQGRGGAARPDPLLTDTERLLLRKQLEEERQRMGHQLSMLVRTFDELVEAADLEPPDDEHDPDGTTAYERAQVTSLADEARDRLRALDRALAAVEGEAYGRCELCGQPIGLPRLLAVASTTRCVHCADTRSARSSPRQDPTARPPARRAIPPPNAAPWIEGHEPTRFQQAVIDAVGSLAEGELVTYGELAEELGRPGGGQAVANVLRHAPDLPWWRIVPAGGRLYCSHAPVQGPLLEAEGHHVDEQRRIRQRPPAAEVDPPALECEPAPDRPVRPGLRA